MWVYKPHYHKVIKEFFHTTNEAVWRILFKPLPAWPVEDEDRGLDDKNPPVKEWLAQAKNIDEPAPLPEEPRSELLAVMLVLKPYKAPEPKKKETREAQDKELEKLWVEVKKAIQEVVSHKAAAGQASAKLDALKVVSKQ
ncbi:putative E3 ubiquitin-protein ligase ARI8 [Hordeum vulgare]|nr:putative E3 ubiquitin-protein ligase ARI8 [Hordeum vulgare]